MLGYIEWEGLTFKPLETIKKDFEFYDEIKYSLTDKSIQLSGVGMIVDFHYINDLPYKKIQKLFEWNFDVFGLIEKGLAININTLKQ